MNIASIVTTVERFAAIRRTQLKVLGLAVVGAVWAASIRPIDIAGRMPGQTTLKHKRKRLGRWLNNSGIDLDCLAKTVWFKTGARRFRGWRIVAVDWTMTEDYWILMAAVCVKKRAIPLMWRAFPAGTLGRSQNAVEDRFFLDLQEMMGTKARWLVVADRGFRRTELLRWLGELGINYVIRLKDDVWIKARGYEGELRHWRFEFGRILMNRNVQIRRLQPVQAHLVRIWREVNGKPSFWYLATNIEASAKDICRLYEFRMWVEQCFRDLKSKFKMRTSRLRDAAKIARLLLIAALLMLVLLFAGLRAEKKQWDIGRVPQGSAAETWSVITLGLAYILSSRRREARILSAFRPLILPLAAQ